MTLRNIGHLPGSAVQGELQSLSPFLELLVATADFGNIPAGGIATSAEPLVFHVAGDVPDGERLEFALLLSEDPGVRCFAYQAHAPAYFIGVIETDDSQSGNGNGLADPGETVWLRLAIANLGSSSSPAVMAALGSPTGYYLPDETPQSLPSLAPGDGTEAGGFEVAIAASCPPVHADYLWLELGDGAGYAVAVPFVFCTGQAFADGFEMLAGSWRHTALPGGWSNDWHPESFRNHTPGGDTSWKCGGPGDWAYSNLLYAALETAEFYLPPAARLEFWQWVDAESSAAYPGYCYDGGLAEISTDGGQSWTGLTPDGGYPFLIREGSIPGPFPLGTPVWSGQSDWHPVGIDLGAYSGLVKLRWCFGTDGADVREGWYIDDVRVGTGWPSALPDDARTFTDAIRLLEARPNPAFLGGLASGGIVVRLTNPRSLHGPLALFDANGRQVRELAPGPWRPGVHTIAWDGRDASGASVAAGRYFIRLAVADGSVTRPLVVLR